MILKKKVRPYKKDISLASLYTYTRQAIMESLRFPPDRHAGEWAEANLVLSKNNSEPGKYSMDRTPYVRSIFEALKSSKYSIVVVVGAVQVFKTQVALNWIGNVLDDDPANCIWISSTTELAIRTSRIKFRQELLRNSTLAEKWNDTKDATYTKEVNGTNIYFGWSNSVSQLSMVNAKYMVGDEIDKWPDNVEKQGDPIELLEGRGTTYPDSILLLVSSPCAEVGEPSKIVGRWLSGTRFKWFWPCPFCFEYFYPMSSMLKYDEELVKQIGENSILKSVYLECPHCFEKILNKHKKWMNSLGVMLAPGEKVENGEVTNINVDAQNNKTASFWVSGLCALWEKKSFGQLALKLYKAKKSNDENRVFAVLTSDFAEEYEPPSEKPSIDLVQTCRRNYTLNQVPSDVICLTGSVDVQKYQLYYVIRGWAKKLNSYLINYGTIEGQTDKDEVWNAFENMVLGTIFENKAGRKFRTKPFWIDCGWRPQAVYEFCCRNRDLYFPVRGIPEETNANTIKPVQAMNVYDAKDRNNNPLGQTIIRYKINDSYYKSDLYRRMDKPRGDEGRWYIPRDVDEFYIKSVTAEEKIKLKSGKTKWRSTFRHNHYLDCEKIQLAIADHFHLVNI